MRKLFVLFVGLAVVLTATTTTFAQSKDLSGSKKEITGDGTAHQQGPAIRQVLKEASGRLKGIELRLIRRPWNEKIGIYPLECGAKAHDSFPCLNYFS